MLSRLDLLFKIIFLKFSENLVPPGSLVTINGYFFFVEIFLKVKFVMIYR